MIKYNEWCDKIKLAKAYFRRGVLILAAAAAVAATTDLPPLTPLAKLFAYKKLRNK